MRTGGDLKRAQRLLEEVLLLPVAPSLRTLKLRNLYSRLGGDLVVPVYPLLSADFLAALPARCPRLTSLDLGGCPELNDGFALALAPLPLRELRLADNPQLTEGALQALLKRSSDALRIVDFSKCANRAVTSGEEYLVTPIAPSGWEPLRVEELSLRGWTTPLRHLRIMSEEFDFSKTRQNALAVLDLTKCDQLRTVSLCLPTLRKFTANGCYELRNVHVEESPNLAELHLSSCGSLNSLTANESHAIEIIRLFGCRNVPEARVRTLLQNNGATLRQLNLNGALNTVNIEEAEIRKLCPNLEELDAKGRARKY
jgi:hypothetical protein